MALWSLLIGLSYCFQGLAQLLGRHLVTHQCSPQADPAALGKLMQGLAMVSSKLTHTYM